VFRTFKEVIVFSRCPNSKNLEETTSSAVVLISQRALKLFSLAV
jgi:hypothetical protein